MPAFTNATQTIPEVFKQIIENDKKQAALRAQDVIPFSITAELIRDRRNNLVPSAERMLRWNTDKGNER